MGCFLAGSRAAAPLVQEMPTSPWAPHGVLAHTGLAQPSHFASAPVHLMLASRAVPAPCPKALGRAMPAAPRLSCMGRHGGFMKAGPAGLPAETTCAQGCVTHNAPAPPTCLHTTVAAAVLKPLLQAGFQLPWCSSSRRPETRPATLVALTKRAVTATQGECRSGLLVTRWQPHTTAATAPSPVCSVLHITPTSSLCPLQGGRQAQRWLEAWQRCLPPSSAPQPTRRTLAPHCGAARRWRHRSAALRALTSCCCPSPHAHTPPADLRRHGMTPRPATAAGQRPRQSMRRAQQRRCCPRPAAVGGAEAGHW